MQDITFSVEIFITLRQAGKRLCPCTLLISSKTQPLKNPPSNEGNEREVGELRICNSYIEGIFISLV